MPACSVAAILACPCLSSVDSGHHRLVRDTPSPLPPASLSPSLCFQPGDFRCAGDSLPDLPAAKEPASAAARAGGLGDAEAANGAGARPGKTGPGTNGTVCGGSKGDSTNGRNGERMRKGGPGPGPGAGPGCEAVSQGRDGDDVVEIVVISHGTGPAGLAAAAVDSGCGRAAGRAAGNKGGRAGRSGASGGVQGKVDGARKRKEVINVSNGCFSLYDCAT